MATQAHQVDQVLSRSVGNDADAEEAIWLGATQIYGDGRWPCLPYATACEGNRNHRPVGPEVVRLIVDTRCGCFCRAARLHRRPKGNRIPGCYRPAHASGARLVAGIAPQARQEIVQTLPPLP